jgi:hypothetical protein
MGEKPDTVIEVAVNSFVFNQRKFNRLLIDIEHINKGKNKNKTRSSLTINDVVSIALSLHQLVLEPVDQKDSYSYFSLDVENSENGKMSRIIFLTENYEDYLGIITIYRISTKGAQNGPSKKR